MTFGEAISVCMSKPVTFSGRASRSEYWYWVLFCALSLTAAGGLDYVVNTNAVLSILNERGWFVPYGTAYKVTLFALLLPYSAVTTRRFHDTGRSGWASMMNFVPLVGFLVMMYWLMQRSQPVDNKYGKAIEDDVPALVAVFE